MATNLTHGTFEDILRSASSELRPVCGSLRQTIHRLHSDALEVVWKKQRIASFGVGPKKMSEHYAYIALQRTHVNLGFYHGATLSDPKGLLEGAGKRLRHIKIKNAKVAKSTAIEALIRAAIIDRKQKASEA